MSDGGWGSPPGQPPGGGGWGNPPSGGSPPGPPGGGEWGPPPGHPPGQPPGGGGFGPSPPSGGGFGGGGDPGLAHIPFSEEDLGNIETMAFLMNASAALLVAGQLLGMVATLAWMFVGIGSGEGSSNSGSGGIGGGVIWLAVTAGMAAMLYFGAQSFRKVVDTDDADQKNLEDGLGYLRNYFMIKGLYWAFSLISLCCCCAAAGIGAFFFAALLGTLVGAH